VTREIRGRVVESRASVATGRSVFVDGGGTAEEEDRSMSFTLPPDGLNEIGVLKRREIEARILAPVIDALGAEFGRDRVIAMVRDVIVRVAREQGQALAGRMGGDSLTDFARALDDWQRGDALRMDVLEQSDDRFAFKVTRTG
jgi:hypothetical protein